MSYKIKLQRNNCHINFLSVITKHFSKTINRTIGWPPLIISGPPSSGKTTLKNHLLSIYPQFESSVPYTTRQPEKNEKHGHDYFFIETETFENDLRANKFIEYSKIDGHFYGNRRDTITHIVNTGKICVLELDTKSLKMALGNGLKIAYRIFVTPPNLEVMKARLSSNYETNNEELINRVIIEASKEIEMATHLNLYHYMIENKDKEIFLENASMLIKKLYPFVDAKMKI